MTIAHKVMYAMTAPEKQSNHVGMAEHAHLLACSATRTQAHLLASREINGPLCMHRKGFLDHLHRKPLMRSTLRIVTQQATMIAANFMTEQLAKDMERSELVNYGKMSQLEADEQSEEWEKAEWEKRWRVFPQKLLTAFAKYHVITLTVRLYEYVAAQCHDKVTLDKLTMDPFYAATRMTASNGSNSDNQKIAREMFHTSLWANVISFMADYSVHQVILCYGYYIYVRERRKRGGEEEEGMNGAIVTSLLTKSTRLLVSRAAGLVASSTGSAIGTVVWPGWGTLLFGNMAEGLSGVVLDDAPSAAPNI